MECPLPTHTELASPAQRLTEGSWQIPISLSAGFQIFLLLGHHMNNILRSALIEVMEHWATAEDLALLFFALEGQLQIGDQVQLYWNVIIWSEWPASVFTHWR